MRLRLTPRAVADLGDIADYIHQRNPQASSRVRDALSAGLDIIATYPLAGRERKHGVRRFSLPRFPYLIFYRVDQASNEVVVFTIRHAARRD